MIINVIPYKCSTLFSSILVLYMNIVLSIYLSYFRQTSELQGYGIYIFSVYQLTPESS